MSFTRFGLWVFFAGIVVLTGEVSCLRGSALVAELKAKAKAALLNPTEIVPVEELQGSGVDGEGVNGTTSNSTESANKTRSLLTGNPQKDYIYDPNLPRELNGYNLSSYPFYNGVPDDIDFKCDDLHDGFYASVPHKCQVYHHCLFGTRYDFLCANYTAFDQKTFICHFVSEVDCDNSPKYYQRNEALYKSATTTTSAPLVLRQTAPPPTTTAQPTQRPRRRRPLRRRRPVYEYYYDDQYEDEEYYDDEPLPPRRKMNRKHRPQGGYRDEEDDYYEGRRDSSRGESSRAESSRGDGDRGEGRGSSSGDNSQDGKATLRISGPAAGTVYDRPRVPPKIRRPVPIHERDKYDYTAKSSEGGSSSNQTPKKNKPQPEVDEDEYYDEEYEDDYVKPLPKRGKLGNDYSMESSGKSDSRRSNSRQRPRQHSRRRPDRYEDEYEDDRPLRPRKRFRHEETTQSGRGNRGGYRGYSRDEPDPVPAERPGFISNTRFSSGNRKRPEDDRGQITTKKTYGRVVYDDEEDEEEYYDDEEEDTHEDDASRRNHKHTNNGRRSDEYEPEGRKPINQNRKQTNNFKPQNHGSRSEETQSTERSQGGFLRSENRKPSLKQKPEESIVSSESKDEQCRNSCEDDYLDESSADVKEGKKKENLRDNHNKPINEQETQRQMSERDRLFSTRFRDNQSESKTKQQIYEPPVRTPSTPPTLRTTTQFPELSQRYKPSIRMKPITDDAPVTPKFTTTTTAEDYADEPSTPKFSNFRSKGRIVPPTPLINNYKSVPTTEQVHETDLLSNISPESESKIVGPEEYIYSSSEKPFVSPRPFSGIARRPLKQSTDTAFADDSAEPPKIPDSKTRAPTYRQPSIVDEDDDKSLRKSVNLGQNFKRIKPEPPKVENVEYNQPKLPITGNNFRRPNKPEETTPDEIPYSKDVQEDTSQVDLRKGGKVPFPDKSLIGSPNYGNVYRRVKVSAISTPATESEVSTSTYDNFQTVDETPVVNPVNNNKRPYAVVRPLNNSPVVVDDSPKSVLAPNVPLRRPIKQKVQDTGAPIVSEEYSPTSGTDTVSDNYRKPDPNLSVNLRQNYGYFPPKRGKIRIDENGARVLDQYPKQLTLNQEGQFAKQLPKIEITAPGPSAPELDIATVKSNYNSGPQGFSLDIPEEEYDVTLNDALQPSTLHPTRSLVDYHQTRLKSRDYQSNPGRSPEYVNRGSVSYLLPAASQQVQSVFAPETGRDEKKDAEEYEAVVLTAPGDRWANQRRNRPTEWFW